MPGSIQPSGRKVDSRDGMNPHECPLHETSCKFRNRLENADSVECAFVKVSIGVWCQTEVITLSEMRRQNAATFQKGNLCFRTMSPEVY